MRIDNLAYPVIPQYIQEIRPDNDEKSGRHKPVKNPAALPLLANGLWRQKERSVEDSGALVILSRSDFSPGLQTPKALSPAYAPSNNIFQPDDEFFMRVRTAYDSLNNENYKGLYVDKLV